MHKRSKNRTKITHPVHFFSLYWISLAERTATLRWHSCHEHTKEAKTEQKSCTPSIFFPFIGFCRSLLGATLRWQLNGSCHTRTKEAKTGQKSRTPCIFFPFIGCCRSLLGLACRHLKEAIQGREHFVSHTHTKEAKNGTKITHPVHIFSLYWILSLLIRLRVPPP
jgi:hypothetical protein